MSIGVDFGIIGQVVFGPLNTSGLTFGPFTDTTIISNPTFGHFAQTGVSFGPIDFQASATNPQFIIWDNLGGTAKYFQMEGWYAAGQVYEYWVVAGTPSNNPPSGHILQDVRIAASWVA